LYNGKADLTEEFETLVVEVEGTNTTTTESSVFIMETGQQIEQEQATDIVRKLSDKAATHALLKGNNYKYLATDQYRPDEFYSIIIDTEAAGKSTAGYNQYTVLELQLRCSNSSCLATALPNYADTTWTLRGHCVATAWP
jgi:hypothetical protein